jgi:hypothetical protein
VVRAARRETLHVERRPRKYRHEQYQLGDILRESRRISSGIDRSGRPSHQWCRPSHPLAKQAMGVSHVIENRGTDSRSGPPVAFSNRSHNWCASGHRHTWHAVHEHRRQCVAGLAANTRVDERHRPEIPEVEELVIFQLTPCHVLNEFDGLGPGDDDRRFIIEQVDSGARDNLQRPSCHVVHPDVMLRAPSNPSAPRPFCVRPPSSAPGECTQNMQRVEVCARIRSQGGWVHTEA